MFNTQTYIMSIYIYCYYYCIIHPLTSAPPSRINIMLIGTMYYTLTGTTYIIPIYYIGRSHIKYYFKCI